MIFWVIVVTLTDAIFTTEIRETIEALMDFKVLVEISNFNLDLPKASYIWSELPDFEYNFENITFYYKSTKKDHYNNKTYWKLLTKFQDGKQWNNELDWKTFSVILLHSEKFDLIQSFYFRPSEGECEARNLDYSFEFNSLLIRAHPLEHITFWKVNEMFIKNLNSTGFFSRLQEYKFIVNSLLKLLLPITIVEEDSRALFYEQNEEFEGLYGKTLQRLSALKENILHNKIKSASQIQSTLNFSAFSYWIEILPEKSPTLSIHLSLAFVFLSQLSVIITILLNKKFYKGNKE